MAFKVAGSIAFKNAVAGALFERHMGFGQKRRASRDEKPHMPDKLAIKARVVQKAGVKGRHAHHACGARQVFDHLVLIEFRQEDHRGPGQQDHIGRHEKPMRVKDRQRVKQHVFFGKGPVVDQRFGI